MPTENSQCSTGLRTGDRVGIWSPNRVEWALVQYATAKAGIVLVNINPAYRTHELVPRHVFLWAEFPLTVAGKVQKFKLREQAQAQLEPHDAAVQTA
ncbi:MAG TPA: AMP-binding protein [Solirubrobacteraceae bacterium]|nr:AMP-binding protein [Solirubrobacteraceae bacterium]